MHNLLTLKFCLATFIAIRYELMSYGLQGELAWLRRSVKDTPSIVSAKLISENIHRSKRTHSECSTALLQTKVLI